MGKRDIKIDYGLIDDILRELKKYSEGLEEMQSAVEKINRTIHTSSDADSVRQLEKRYHKVKKRLDDSHEEVDALYHLLNSYRKDMTAIIRPKKGMTRVGRNDIYWNLKTVKMAIRDVMEVKKDVPLITDMGMDRTDAEKQAMTENYGKLENQIWQSILSELNTEMEKSKKKLEGYYKDKVVEYENMDDRYCLKAEKVRMQYASTWDHMKQAFVGYAEEQKQLAKGALRAVTDFVKGLVFIDRMLYYAERGPAAAVIVRLSPQPPEWAEKMLGESQEYFGPIAEALTHPVDAVKAMVQETSDTYETEGLEYTGAYVVADIMIGKAVTSGISKAVGKGAGAVDEIGDVANKADDVADVAGTAGKMDDIAEIAETAGKADDVAKLADDIGDFYDDIYRGCYDEPFNPIEEGAILDPDDIVENLSEKTGNFRETLSELDKVGYDEFCKRTRGILKTEEEMQIAFSELCNRDFKNYIKHFDFSTEIDKAYFWSGDKDFASNIAKINKGTIMENTPGGKVLDGWEWINEKFPAAGNWGTGNDLDPKPLWQAASKEYAKKVKGKVTYVNQEYEGAVWLKDESPIVDRLLEEGVVTEVEYYNKEFLINKILDEGEKGW